MSTSTLEIILDLMEQTKAVRHLDPEVAGHLERAVESLLGGVGLVTAQEAADELGVTKPTIQNWLDAGYLIGERTSKRTLIAAGSVLQLMPVVREARRQGIAYPATAIREWFEEMRAVTAEDRLHVDERRERLLARKLGHARSLNDAPHAATPPPPPSAARLRATRWIPSQQSRIGICVCATLGAKPKRS